MNTHQQDKFTYYFTQAFKIAFMVLAFSLLAGGVVMWLWNWLMPSLFGLTTIGFWQAIGLIILSKILFSGFGGKGGYRHNHTRNYWGRKWYNMNESDKQAFKNKLKNKYCENADLMDDKEHDVND